MGSRVTFRDNTTDQTRTVTLVYPEDADVAQNRISSCSRLIGAALIGLSVSQSIEWQTLEGKMRSLTVIAADTVRMMPPASISARCALYARARSALHILNV